MDFVFSKSLSLGLGNDNYMFPNISIDLPTGPMGEMHFNYMRDFSDKKHHEKCDLDSPVKRKKRRMSSLGFLTPSFFEDHLGKSSRRNSMSSVFKPETAESDLVLKEEVDCDDESKDDDMFPIELLNAEHPKVDPEKMKTTIVSFREAMEKSQKSQQSIHDWDRKMGLKRSHSKTMRLTTRSRKKLRSVLKTQLSALAA